MIAAGKSTNEGFSLAAFLPETRVRGSSFEKPAFIGALAWLSSTARWGCGYRCDGTASGPLVGLDYAQNRYYASTLGRFTTPDPYKSGTGSGSPGDPGSWNRYAYVMGDPITLMDPNGTCGTPSNYDQSGDVIRVSVSIPCDSGGSGGGYGSVQRIVPEAPAAWDGLSADCQNALRQAMPARNDGAGIPQWLRALDRANAAKNTLSQAASAHGIDWELLAAIGVRETGFRDIAQSNGDGRGVFQIDIGKNPSVTASQAFDTTWAADWAANLLATNMNTLGSKYPNLDPEQLLQATAASYNFGTRNIHGNPNAIDLGTTHNNYGSNVLGLMDCFH